MWPVANIYHLAVEARLARGEPPLASVDSIDVPANLMRRATEALRGGAAGGMQAGMDAAAAAGRCGKGGRLSNGRRACAPQGRCCSSCNVRGGCRCRRSRCDGPSRS